MWLLPGLLAVALLPLVKGLTPECKPSFGHFFGNAEEVDRGCCLSELGVRFCNKINVSKENVIRHLAKFQANRMRKDTEYMNCSDTEPVFSVPLFGLSAWSSEYFAIDQRDDALQIVQQSFCDSKCCALKDGCKQIYDSIELTVKDSTTLSVISRKIFVGVGCDYGSDWKSKRQLRSADDPQNATTWPNVNTGAAIDVTTSTMKAPSVSNASPEATSFATSTPIVITSSPVDMLGSTNESSTSTEKTFTHGAPPSSSGQTSILVSSSTSGEKTSTLSTTREKTSVEVGSSDDIEQTTFEVDEQTTNCTLGSGCEEKEIPSDEQTTHPVNVIFEKIATSTASSVSSHTNYSTTMTTPHFGTETSSKAPSTLMEGGHSTSSLSSTNKPTVNYSAISTTTVQKKFWESSTESSVENVSTTFSNTESPSNKTSNTLSSESTSLSSSSFAVSYGTPNLSKEETSEDLDFFPSTTTTPENSSKTTTMSVSKNGSVFFEEAKNLHLSLELTTSKSRPPSTLSSELTTSTHSKSEDLLSSTTTSATGSTMESSTPIKSLGKSEDSILAHYSGDKPSQRSFKQAQDKNDSATNSSDPIQSSTRSLSDLEKNVTSSTVITTEESTEKSQLDRQITGLLMTDFPFTDDTDIPEEVSTTLSTVARVDISNQTEIQPLALRFGPLSNRISTQGPNQVRRPGPIDIPPGYLQKAGVGIDDPIDHNFPAKSSLNLLAAPQYKIKRNRGIITYYRDCVGIPLHKTEDHPCVFPFIYLGKVHTACTTMEDNLPWCATAVDSNQHMVTNDWGYCTAVCPIETRTCKTVVGGPIVNVFCRFPFRYRGIEYYTCTTDDDSGPWCATQVDAHGDYMPDFWGRCECPEALNQTVSGGRRELDDLSKDQQGVPFKNVDAVEQVLNLGGDNPQRIFTDFQATGNPFESMPFKTSTDRNGNIYLVTKKPQYFWENNPPKSGSIPESEISAQQQGAVKSTPKYNLVSDFPWNVPKSTSRPNYYSDNPSNQVSTTDRLITGSLETWSQGSAGFTTQRSLGSEITTEKPNRESTTPSKGFFFTTTTYRSQTTTPWYMAKISTAGFPKSSRGVELNEWMVPFKTSPTTITTSTTTTTTTLSPIRLMSLRKRRPVNPKELPTQGTLATYIPSFLNDTVQEEFLLKYGLNLKIFEAST